MDVEVIRCPACGGTLEIKSNSEYTVCQFCNNTIAIKRRNVNRDGSITFVDKATGMALGSAVLPFGYEPTGMILPNVSTNIYPITISCSAYDKNGTTLTYFTGEGYTDSSKCPMLTGPYSKVVNQISRVAFCNFVDAENYCDSYMQKYATNANASSLYLLEQREYPLLGGFNYAESMELYKRRVAIALQRQGFDTTYMLDYYQKAVCRIYSMDVQGYRYRVAVALVLEGNKYKIPSMMGMGLGLGLLGGLLNKNQPNNANYYFGNLEHNQVIEWQSNGVFMLQSFENNFEEAFKGAFTDFCSTFKVDSGIIEQSYNMQNQMQQEVANYTRQNIANQQRNFAAWQQINKSMQDAFDSYNQAWWDRNNSSYQASRARYDSGYSSSGDFSEAIRGVNTYIRDDGTEVEVSVSYDRAYSNSLGDTLATNSAFEPGGNWVEMQRK